MRGTNSILALVLVAVPGLLYAQGSNTIAKPSSPGVAAQAASATSALSSLSAKQISSRPNVVLVMLDDVGFAASSAFGGPIPTPNLDRLAAHGLKYNRFHTTAICSATRAALLTGRNHHSVGVGNLVEFATPHPGYTGVIPKSAATVARLLRDNDYDTAMFGKHHDVPMAEQSMVGPFDRWPTGLGFEYFYGFIGGETNQFVPSLYENTIPVDLSIRDADYILDRDLVDHALKWIHNQKASGPDRPFFVYLAPGTAHAPLHAPRDWIAKFKGRFDQGWDKVRNEIFTRQKKLGVIPANAAMTPRPGEIPAWESLSNDDRRVYARFMEVYAAMLAYQDNQFGRILDELDRMQQLDNTLVIFIGGDNGASADGAEGAFNEIEQILNFPRPSLGWMARNLDLIGGPYSYGIYPTGWAYALSTPFPYYKQIASHLGGVRNGLVLSWPAGIQKQGQVRAQYHHVIDIMPTILTVAGVTPPEKIEGVEQQRIDGVSMAYSFNAPDAPSARRTQYYEILGNRGIYHDGFLANTTPRFMPWTLGEMRPGTDVASYTWELYDLDKDFSQSNNLAAHMPAKVKEMRALFNAEAENNNVFPIQDSGGGYRMSKNLMGNTTRPKHYEFWSGNIRLNAFERGAPPIFSGGFSIRARIDVPADGGNGVIVGAGSIFGGWSFFLRDGIPVVVSSASSVTGDQSRTAARRPLAKGLNTVELDFQPNGRGGDVTIKANGTVVATGYVNKRPGMIGGAGETFDVGLDSNLPVSQEITGSGLFNGTILNVSIDIE